MIVTRVIKVILALISILSLSIRQLLIEAILTEYVNLSLLEVNLMLSQLFYDLPAYCSLMDNDQLPWIPCHLSITILLYSYGLS